VPKSKVRKKDPAVPMALRTEAVKGGRPARALAPSPTWYPIVMAIILVIGLAYLVAYYLASDDISFMNHLGAWNFAVGFGILVAGLIMAVRWR
jgi:hypothetical protein